ncbi:hypothetical protein ACFY5K_15010 [Streptomyces griseofuscus]|nr:MULTISPECIES: hypothetical protein [unclassified Streptomyces]MBJ7002500.1 hypothetical protein [Streptomyces sp. CRPSP2-6A1]MYR88726.1 hypothetical protein [Streptomyces sp. SID685]
MSWERSDRAGRWGKSYIQIRRTLRDFLLSSPDAEELDQLVTELLG